MATIGIYQLQRTAVLEAVGRMCAPGRGQSARTGC